MDDLVSRAPALSLDEALACARDAFGIAGEPSLLPSERDQNILLRTQAGTRFVLKIANPTEDRAILDAQNAALAYVARGTALCPRIVKSIDGADIAEVVSSSGIRHFVRLLTWVAGVPMGSLASHPPELLEDLGRKIAELDAALDGFDHPAIHRDFYWDLAKGLDIVRELTPLVADPGMRGLVARVADKIDFRDAPGFAALRRAAVHNDPNDYNVLVSDDRVTGILDFGDIVHSYAIADLAIAVAYAVLGKDDPLAAAVSVTRGYQAVRPLDDDEIESLLGLVLLRLCTSVCVAARQQQQRPDDVYLSVSQGPIAQTLPVLAALDRAAVAESLRSARGRTWEATLAARRRVVGPNLSVAYRHPVKVARGSMQYLLDHTGRRYLDAYNNVPHVGHSHPRVVQAAVDQMLLVNTNTRYLHDGLSTFAERLTDTLPHPLRVCYFVNSGSEANELALRLARAYTRRRDVIVLDAAYHGNTTTLIDISPYKFNGPGGEGAPPWVHVLPLPDTYRGKHKRDDPRAGEKYAEFARQVRNPSAFIAESAPSVGGQIMLPDKYLASVYAIVRAAGGVCIADEVQTAYGRTGTHCYAFESQDVVPDIVVLGKPIGNGYPLGAVVTTTEIAAAFDNGMEFFSTFGGSTVSCAVGLAVLDVVQEERLQDHAAGVGASLLEALRQLAARHPLIGDVRGSGLFLGVELVKDRETLEPAAAEASDVVNRMRERGILLGTDGPFANVLKIRPPMPFTLEDADQLVAALDEVLAWISIIIPAYNEEALLDGTLAAIRAAAETLGSPHEVIVVDDGSTDRTAEIARAHGARVVGVNLRNIGAARNAGARVASGDLLIFVDADTLVTPAVLQGAVASIRAGAVGGGAGVRQDSNDPAWGPAVYGFAGLLMRMAGWAAGCFMFVRTDIFHFTGGFDERYFATEEIHLSRAVKKYGRFVILRDRVITSARKGRLFTTREVVAQLLTAVWPGNLKRRDRLGAWYGGKREKDGK